MSKKRSKVTVDLPDELILELIVVAKSHQVSIRQLTREAFKAVARRELSATPMTISSKFEKKVH